MPRWNHPARAGTNMGPTVARRDALSLLLYVGTASFFGSSCEAGAKQPRAQCWFHRSLVPRVDSYPELRGLGASYRVVYVQGAVTPGDGGEGYFAWRPEDAAADNGGTILRSVRHSKGAWFRVFQGAVSVQWFGARTDGRDNTSAIQASIDSLSEGGTVWFPAGVWGIGNDKNREVTIRGARHRFCLSLPSNVTVMLDEEATIRLNDNAASHVFTNTGIEGTGNVNIRVTGGTYDLNHRGNPRPITGEISGGLFDNVENLTIENVRHVNVPQYALRASGVAGGVFTDLYCTSSHGSGYAFGSRRRDDESPVIRCRFDNVRTEHCVGRARAAPGNGFILFGHHCQLGLIEDAHSRLGIKIQDGSSHIEIARVVASHNVFQGFKLQGTDARLPNQSARPNRHINIQEISTHDNGGAGVHIHQNEDVSIGSIESYDDGHGNEHQAPTAAVRVGKTERCDIGTIRVWGAGKVGLHIRADARSVRVGTVLVEASGRTQPAVNVAVQGSDIEVGRLETVGAPGVVNGLQVLTGAANVRIGSIRADGPFLHWTGAVRSDLKDKLIIDHAEVNGRSHAAADLIRSGVKR